MKNRANAWRGVRDRAGAIATDRRQFRLAFARMGRGASKRAENPRAGLRAENSPACSRQAGETQADCLSARLPTPFPSQGVPSVLNDSTPRRARPFDFLLTVDQSQLCEITIRSRVSHLSVAEAGGVPAKSAGGRNTGQFSRRSPWWMLSPLVTEYQGYPTALQPAD